MSTTIARKLQVAIYEGQPYTRETLFIDGKEYYRDENISFPHMKYLTSEFVTDELITVNEDPISREEALTRVEEFKFKLYEKVTIKAPEPTPSTLNEYIASSPRGEAGRENITTWFLLLTEGREKALDYYLSNGRTEKAFVMTFDKQKNIDSVKRQMASIL